MLLASKFFRSATYVSRASRSALFSSVKKATNSKSVPRAQQVEGLATLEAPVPGSVKPYVAHIFVEYDYSGTSPQDLGSFWAADLEKEGQPLHAIVQALKARKEAAGGLVKITAVSPLRESGAPHAGLALPAPGKCHATVFTATGASSHEGVAFGGEEVAELFEKSGRGLETGLHLFVCVHGSRDRRCAVLGEPLLAALHDLSKKHGLYAAGPGKVHLYRCSHIGGHAYAGNVLCFSSQGGQLQLKDWLGGVSTDNAESVLTSLVAGVAGGRMGSSEELLRSDVLRPLWRGRMNLGEEEQAAVHRSACEACAAAGACSGGSTGSGSN